MRRPSHTSDTICSASAPASGIAIQFIKAHYYHPAFNGSYSIKAVLPAIVPRLAYDDLEIREGAMASLQFYRMVFGNGDLAEKARLRTALLAYCERDTLAIV